MTGAVILAAGLSSRMNDFKPLLPLGDTTFIGSIIERMRAAGVGPIRVVTGWRAEELDRRLAGIPDLATVLNPDFPVTQMFDSIRIGISSFAELPDRLLITPADIPLVEVSTIERLISCRASCAKPCEAATGVGGHPLMVSRACAEGLMGCTAGETLKTALANLGVQPVKVLVNDPAIHMDADTQEDYGALLEYAAAHGMAAETVRPRVGFSLWVGSFELTAGLIRLLELADACGSLRRAADAMRISYSTAWRRLRAAETALHVELLARSSGGAAGGGSQLTGSARELVARWRIAADEVTDAGEAVGKRLFSATR